MLQYQTVLIVGAGASVDYGFPTGVQLCSQIHEQLDSIVQHHEFDSFLTYERKDFERFHNELYYSGMNSPDQFLEHRPEYIEVGKAAIAAFLIQKEVPDVLFKYSRTNWLRDLYARIGSSIEELRSSKLAIITFNYDRCIEYFFHTAIKHTYSLDDAVIAEIIKSIPIVHLHGQLGYLPWQDQQAVLTRPFNIDISPLAIKSSIVGIKIIHEDPADRDKDFKRANDILQQAEQIFFFGFGFNQKNMERLHLSSLKDKRCYATALGLGGQQRLSVAKYLDKSNQLQFEELDCSYFIRERML